MVSISNFMHEWLSSKVELLSAEKVQKQVTLNWCVRLTFNQCFSNPIEKKGWSRVIFCYPACLALEFLFLPEDTPSDLHAPKIPSSSFRTQTGWHVALFEKSSTCAVCCWDVPASGQRGPGTQRALTWSDACPGWPAPLDAGSESCLGLKGVFSFLFLAVFFY